MVSKAPWRTPGQHPQAQVDLRPQALMAQQRFGRVRHQHHVTPGLAQADHKAPHVHRVWADDEDGAGIGHRQARRTARIATS